MDNGKIVTADDFASGGRAAIAGGTTLLIDFATQDKGHLMGEAFYQWMAKAEQKCSCLLYTSGHFLAAGSFGTAGFLAADCSLMHSLWFTASRNRQ